VWEWKAVDLPPPDRERQVVDRRHLAEALREALDRDDRLIIHQWFLRSTSPSQRRGVLKLPP
jgi:hypothetical protein